MFLHLWGVSPRRERLPGLNAEEIGVTIILLSVALNALLIISLVVNYAYVFRRPRERQTTIGLYGRMAALCALMVANAAVAVVYIHVYV